MTAMPRAGKVPSRAGRDRARHGDQRAGNSGRKPAESEDAGYYHVPREPRDGRCT